MTIEPALPPSVSRGTWDTDRIAIEPAWVTVKSGIRKCDVIGCGNHNVTGRFRTARLCTNCTRRSSVPQRVTCDSNIAPWREGCFCLNLGIIGHRELISCYREGSATKESYRSYHYPVHCNIMSCESDITCLPLECLCHQYSNIKVDRVCGNVDIAS